MPGIKIRPTLAEARKLAERGGLIPVCGTVPNDVHTPVSLFMCLAGESPSFLLESVEGGESVARYSYIGVQLDEALVLTGSSVVLRRLVGDGCRETPLPSTRPADGSAREGDFLDVLRKHLWPNEGRHESAVRLRVPDLPPLTGGLVGYVGYDAVRQFERLPETATDPLGVPEAAFLLANTVIAVDHAKHRIQIVTNIRLDHGPDGGPDDSPDASGPGALPLGRGVAEAYADAVARIRTIKARFAGRREEPRTDLSAELTPPKGNKTRSEYEGMVRAAKELIRAGDIFQVVLSRRVERRTMVHPFAIYRALRPLNPSPWMFYIQFGGLLQSGRREPVSSSKSEPQRAQRKARRAEVSVPSVPSVRTTGARRAGEPLYLVGASPELHAGFDASSRMALVTPIAGTRRRGETEEEDERLAEGLLADPKERSEHAMLVDLGRNDIGRVAKYGTVETPRLFTIERYSHVMHIVSHVVGEVREGLDAFDVLRATFPAGTLSGAPKIRAMEIIEDLEGERRGPYGGCIGYFSFTGDMGTCITIRTMLMKGDRCYVQAGAGIVADSDPSREYEESVNKARAVMLAIDAAEEDL